MAGTQSRKKRNKGNDMKQIKHVVWPTEAPPVCTANWDQITWDNWGEKSRPPDYFGNEYSETEWGFYKDIKRILREEGRDGVLKHARVSSTHGCKCGECFCCACLNYLVMCKRLIPDPTYED